MDQNPLAEVTTLTFDIFGTTLDLTGSLVPPLNKFLDSKDSSTDGAEFWAQWRARQRIEQYQDTLLMLGHSGYLEVCKRAFLYTLRNNQVEFTYEEVDDFMKVWINGELILSNNLWSQPKAADVTKVLKQGQNLIAVWGKNHHSPAALLLNLNVRLKNGKQLNVHSDGTWKRSSLIDKGWEKPGFKDADWLPALIIAEMEAPGTWQGIKKSTIQKLSSLPESGDK